VHQVESVAHSQVPAHRPRRRVRYSHEYLRATVARPRNVVRGCCPRRMRCTILIILCASLQSRESRPHSGLADFVATRNFHLQSGDIWQLCAGSLARSAP
jgi:hypothetical protein